MAAQERPVETVMNLTDTKQQFSSVVNRVAREGERIIVEKSGLPAAVIIPVEEYRRLKEAEDDMARDRLEKSLVSFSNAFRDVPDEEFERALAEARREYREITDREHGRT